MVARRQKSTRNMRTLGDAGVRERETKMSHWFIYVYMFIFIYMYINIYIYKNFFDWL